MNLNLSQNQKILLDLIRRHGPLPRVQLVELCDITAGAVTRHCKELLLRSLIATGAPISGTRGQPARPLSIDPAGAFSIGVSFYPHQIDFAALDFAGKPIEAMSLAYEEVDPASTAQKIARQVNRLAQKHRLPIERCLGLGLAIPGFSQDQGATRHTVGALSSWRGVDLEAVFSQQTGMPVWVENVASAGAFSDFYHANDDDKRTTVFIHLGYGIGAGIVTNGRLYSGTLGNSGEIGGFFPLDEPRPSGLDLIQNLHRAGFKIRRLADIDEEIAHSDVLAKWIERATDQLCEVVYSAKCWLAPELVSIGGPIRAEILATIANATSQKVAAKRNPIPGPVIVPSKLGPLATAIGAAWMPIHYNCSPSQNAYAGDYRVSISANS